MRDSSFGLPTRVGQELDELVGSDASNGIAVVEQRARELSLRGVHFDDTLFDAVLGDETVNGDRSLLTDAVGAIGGLCLHRGVPPRIEVNYVVCGGQIEPEPAGFE